MAATGRRGPGKEIEVMILDDDDEGAGSPPPDDNQDQPRFFRRSLETLEELAKVLACVKCGKLSGKRIYTLGTCTHKYCDKCVTSTAGRPCVTCKVTAYPKDAKPDLFSTSILAEIPAIYLAITRMEQQKKMKPDVVTSSCVKKGAEEVEIEDEEGRQSSSSSPGGGGNKSLLKEDDDGINSMDLKSNHNHPLRPFTPPKENSMKMISSMDDEDDDDAGMGMELDMSDDFQGGKGPGEEEGDKHEVFAAELDEEIFENTPASKMIPNTPDPDVMEETPQHKANTSMTSLSFSRKGRSGGKGSFGMGRKVQLQPKVLAMESQEKSKEVDSSKTTIETSAEVIDPKSSIGGGKKAMDEDETLFSEEELFRSQTSPSPSVNVDGRGGGGRELPVLTPQVSKQPPAQENVKLGTGRKPSEEAVKSEKIDLGGKDKNNKNSPKPKEKPKVFVWSSSEEDEPEPPSLTQHGKKVVASHVETAKPKSNQQEVKATIVTTPKAIMTAPKPKTPPRGNKNKGKGEVTPRSITLEELFRSQTSDDDGGKAIPILTPHPPVQVAAENAKKRKQSPGSSFGISGSADTSRDIEDPVPEDNKSKRKFFASSRKRNSQEQKPPPLPPHLKVLKRDGTVTVKTATPKTMKETVTLKTVKETATPKTTTAKAVVTSAKGQAKSTPKQNPTKTEESPSSAFRRTTKSRAAKSKLSVSISSSSPEDDALLDYEFQPTPPSTEGESSRKRRRISVPASASNRNNTSSVSLQGGDGGSGKDKEKRNAKGETAMHIACRAGQLSKVKELVEGGADVNATDYAGWTPLHEAIFGKAIGKEKERIIRLLFENDCNINAVGGTDDDTPLHGAVQGPESIVELLLELGASPNIRNSKGQLAVDMAFNEVIIKMLNDKTNRGIVGQVVEASSTSSSSNYDSALTTAPALEEDPAVIQVMLKKAVIYFNYEVDLDVLEKVKNKLKLKVSDKLISKVTHIVHHVTGKSGAIIRVPFSMEYLFGLAHGMWQVGHEWIEKSCRESNCRSPTAFEVSGCSADMNGSALKYPGRARMNKEKGNPGLLDGFCFYLYKTCGYSSSESQDDSGSGLLKMSKRELSALILAAGGKITNREPNPETVDPLEAPPRFHANQDSHSQSPFVLTSHIILYDEMSAPPKDKLYQMEHVKTLRSDWVIESISKFRLEEPAKFL